MDDLAREILDALNRPGATAPAVLDQFPPHDPRFRAIWERHPRLYHEFTERLIREGHPARALDLAQERIEFLKRDPGSPDPDTLPEGYQLRYNLALAAARGGNTGYAESLLRPLLAIARRPDSVIDGMPTRLRVDAVALQGRILKDRARRDPVAFAGLSAEAYDSAANVPGAAELPDRGTFPLVNAATMWRVAGEVERAADRAAEVIRRVGPLVDPAIEQGDYWLPATLAEACVVAGRHDEAEAAYRTAIGMARDRGRTGDIISMRANLLLLVAAGATRDTTWIENHIGAVVVFSGHMIDAPGRRPPRFPNVPALIDAVAAEIRDRLATLNATVGFSSLACGSDVLFAEAMLDRGAELHVVLPFAEADFVRTSVDFGRADDPGMRGWAERYRKVLDRLPADRLHYATTEPYLNTESLFDFVNTFTQGLAILRSRERVVTPRALAVIDGGSAGLPGGTRVFHRTWEAAGFPAEVIDLAAVRERVGTVPPPAPLPAPPVAPPPAALPRPTKGLLFADVAGFSGIAEDRIPGFLEQYGSLLKQAFATPIGHAREFVNTWGDGLHVVFGRPADAAEFALTLLDRAGAVNWAALGLGETVPLRVAVHYGPVFEVPDVFEGTPAYFGQHVNRAARIEPVTVRGCVYASEQFAAHLTMTRAESGKPAYRCESVGVRELPKGFGRCPLYHLTRA